MGQQPQLICAAAPAKLNLHLRVGRRRSDGFHPLVTWMCSVGICDILTFQVRLEPGIWLKCDSPDVPHGRENLVVRAIETFSETLADEGEGTAPEGGVSVFLQKSIPVGAGLGGGSSDAASALLAMNRLWGVSWTIERLARIAARIGSDVPFFVHGRSSVCRGRGELVAPIPSPKPRWAAVFLPPFRLATAAIYQQFDAMGLGDDGTMHHEPDWSSWTQLDAVQVLALLRNDLEPAAFSFRPELAGLRQQLQEQLNRPVRMSGSGSSLFTLYDGQQEAEDAITGIQKELQATRTTTRVVELAVHLLLDETQQRP